MVKTINFCGDSFCASRDENSWIVILSRMLNYEIWGTGKNGSAYEHAIKTFHPTATATVFCWTEPHRLYHPTKHLNMASCEQRKDESKIYAAAHEYYKHLHNPDLMVERKQRDFFWFDEKVLKNYEGKIVHLFSFENAEYPFKHGKVVKKPLIFLKHGLSSIYPNHMTLENNAKLARLVYNLLIK